MVDVTTLPARITTFFRQLWHQLDGWVQATQVPAQVRDVDYMGLFTNPFFLVPFGLFVGYLLFRQALRDLIIVIIILGVWYATGTDYMHTLVVGDEIQLVKVLPVVFGGAGLLALVIYLLFGR